MNDMAVMLKLAKYRFAIPANTIQSFCKRCVKIAEQWYSKCTSTNRRDHLLIATARNDNARAALIDGLLVILERLV